MKNFKKWENEFKRQNLYAFNRNDNALLWLKVRAICRGKQIQKFTESNKITLSSSKITEQNVELFEILEKKSDAMQLLNNFLRERNNEWYAIKDIDKESLKTDLYKVQNYIWGGDQNNSLDKYLIKMYVKEICDYNKLLLQKQAIACNAWNYVQTSWYNNWTSYLIESLFKSHKNVISAVGEIKSVDFFLKDYPIDLKVTFFPNQYLEEKLKIKLGKSELVWIKQKARESQITASEELTKTQQISTLIERLSVIGKKSVIDELKNKRKEVITESQENKTELMKWLYSNQGEMRFGAENRLFVILVDSTDIDQSWKMKRAFDLIEPKIKEYLDNFKEDDLKEIDFTFKGSNYKALADVIFIVK